MTWPAKTYVRGNLWNKADADAYLRDPLLDVRAGGIAIAGQTAQDFVHASSATQFGRVAPASGKIPRFNGMTGQWEMALPAEFVWPVGIIYRSYVSTNPSSLLGVGTWSLLAAGRLTVGFASGDPDFGTVLQTGGAKTVTLSTAELPVHTHLQNSHNHTQNPHEHTATNLANTILSGDAAEPPPLASVADNSGTKTSSSVTATNIATTAVNQNAGGGAAHNNLMPYIVCYIWRRTA